MKIYTDEKNGQSIHVVDGMGFPLSTDITEMGRGMVGDLEHKSIIESELKAWKKGGSELDVITNDKPFAAIVALSYPPYEGKTLDEVIAEFCPEAPEEI